MSKFATYGIALAAALAFSSSASAALEFGMEGDGVTSLTYDFLTGEFSIAAEGGPVALFEIQSESGIFTGDDVPAIPNALLTDEDG
ncbi:MAG: hypothetical protein AAF790_11965, partial [Planctomycetota bacterium]